jgi:deazaflavin-dependent oxidoreductase (nitroreductase family)
MMPLIRRSHLMVGSPVAATAAAWVWSITDAGALPCISYCAWRPGARNIDAVTSHEAAPPSRGQERVVTEFRARGGKVGGYHATMQLLLLTTTGARTGQRRAVPLTYLPDGDRYIVTAGNAGSDRHPAWYHNLGAYPDVTIEVGTEAFEAVALTADEPEQQALYERFAAAYPQLVAYQAQTTRQIPLVILARR